MTVNIGIRGWLRLLLLAIAAAYLWRSALSSKPDKALSRSDRAVRLIGAVLLSAALIFFLGFSLGLYPLFH